MPLSPIREMCRERMLSFMKQVVGMMCVVNVAIAQSGHPVAPPPSARCKGYDLQRTRSATVGRRNTGLGHHVQAHF